MSNRPPDANDNLTKGYRPGSLWLDDGALYACSMSRPETAEWQVVTRSILLPADSGNGCAPLAAYGMRRLTSAYAGPAVQVVRDFDSATQDIGFLPDGALDCARLDRFLDGRVGSVAVWYDQSGNGHHATQANPAKRPRVSRQNLIGSSRSLVFDCPDATAPQPVELVIPASVTGKTNRMSVLALSRFSSAVRTAALFQLDGKAGQRDLWMGNTGSGSCVYWGCRPGSAQLAPSRAAQTPEICGLILGHSGADAVRLINGTTVASSAGIGATALAGGTIGSSAASGGAGLVELSAMLIYAEALTADGQDKTVGSIYTTFGIRPQRRDVIMFAGDSITDGYRSSLLQTYPRQFESMLDYDPIIFNIGSFGQTLRSLSGDDFGFRTQCLPFGPGSANVLVLAAGSNDIAGGAPAQEVYEQLRSYSSKAKAAGWQIILATMLPRADLTGQKQAEWQSYCSMMREGWREIADGLIDFQKDPEIGGVGASRNKSFFYDGVQPTASGYNRMAAAVLPQIQSVMRLPPADKSRTLPEVIAPAPKYKYVLVGCGRWEERDVVEWVLYHKSVGFDHVYFYSNDDDPMATFRVLTPFLFGPDPFVTFQHYPKRHPSQLQQHDIYLHFMQHHKQDTGWFSMLDVDEFYVFKGSNNVKAFMQRFEADYDVVYFNWLVHGFNGKPERDGASVLLSQTRRSRNMDAHTKMITRSSAISEPVLRQKYNETKKTFFHFWDEYDLGLRITNVLGDDIKGYGKDFPSNALTYMRQPGISERMIQQSYIAHFQFKSEADFERRIRRGGTMTVAFWKKTLDDGSYHKRLAAGDEIAEVYLARYWLDYCNRAYDIVVEQPVPPPAYPNVALRKPSWQSSVKRPDDTDPPNSAVTGRGNDGIRSGTFGFATQEEAQPWWMVDLLEDFSVVEIHIYNRMDSPELAGEANGLMLEGSQDAETWQLIGVVDDATPIGGIGTAPLIIRPAIANSARYVRARLNATGTLHLDEIEIYGYPAYGS